MPFQINRRAIGLDDILGAKSWPTVPSQVADQVVVTYPAIKEFRASRRYGGQTNFNATTGTATRQAVTVGAVPATEAWIVENVGVFGTVPAGGSVKQLGVGSNEVGFGDTTIYAGPPNRGVWAVVNFGAAEDARFQWDVNDWVLMPGATLTVTFIGAGLSAISAQLSWSGTRVLL